MAGLDRLRAMTAAKQWEERAAVTGGVCTHDENEHLARYEWAAQRVGGCILDIACGTAYGTALLARAGAVTGLDCDAPTIDEARQRVPGARFVLADVPPVPLPDDAFDWIVSFETIEHLTDDKRFLAELRRVLTPGGHLLLSTPNRAVTSPNDLTPKNPYHVREYLLPELQALMGQAGFNHADVYYQRRARVRVPEVVASAVLARIPRLCKPGTWLDNLGHGSSEVRRWTADIVHPLSWILDGY
jgi:SAM-dependent methyltransferase